MKTALLSSYSKADHVVRLAQLLRNNRWSLVGTSGTARFLSDKGIPCQDVGDLAGRPILGTRITSLARKIHAALIAVSPEDIDELDRLSVRPIGLVYVDFYPIHQLLSSGTATVEQVRDATEVGGLALICSANKGGRLVITEEKQVELLEQWFANGSPESERNSLVIRLAAHAQRMVATYVDACAQFWESQAADLSLR